jgi:hypothetical protein
MQAEKQLTLRYFEIGHLYPFSQDAATNRLAWVHSTLNHLYLNISFRLL